MIKHRSLFGLFAPLGLIALAVWIWRGNPTSVNDVEESFAILAGWPLLLWLGFPWRVSATPAFKFSGPIAAVVLLIVGATAGLVFTMALGWTFLFYAWLRAGFVEGPLGHKRLSVLAFLSFPWLTIDFPAVGWWFRLSGAKVSEFLFKTLGFQVDRSGMVVSVEGLPVEVSQSCSGMNGLQAILIVGTSVAILLFPKQARFWFAIGLLPLLALVSNTVRIVMIAVVGLSFGADFAGGSFHTWGGLGAMIFMFFISMGFLRLMKTSPETIVRRYAT